MIHYTLDRFRSDRAATLAQANLIQIEMNEPAEARLLKGAAGTGFRAPVNKQDAICEVGVEEDVGISGADAGQARHGANPLLANLPRRAVREFPNVRRSRTGKNQVNLFANIHVTLSYSGNSILKPAWAWKHLPGNSFHKRAVAAKPVQWQKPNRSGTNKLSAATVSFIRSGEADSR